jgi:hypothetical protein
MTVWKEAVFSLELWKWRMLIMRCSNCGREVSTGIIFHPTKVENEFVAFCADCSKIFGHCGACQNQYCGFFNNPDPMPQFVIVNRVRREGNMTIQEQRQEPNPERAQKYCVDEQCKCLHMVDGKYRCCRHGGNATCTNYKEIEL